MHEFSRLLQGGTNERGNLERRLAILVRSFLEENSDIAAVDTASA